MGINSHANDAMIRRLEKELEERNAFCQGLIANVQDQERDLNDTEKSSLAEARSRMGKIKDQIDQLEDTARIAGEVAARSRQVDQAISVARKSYENGPVEYRSAGAYALDTYQAAIGSREARERLEVFHRAADHQKTGDNPGVIPTPVVGNVINFIDSARPIVSLLGPMDLPSASWHRPKVTQHTSVGVQGAAGAAADEKSELSSQKMTITRLTANAVTYGGYVNVSRQNIDFSSPQILDLIINDLAGQYAIDTEGATADALMGVGTTPVGIGSTPTAATITAGIWSAAAKAFTATKGQGRLVIAVSPDSLGVFGPLFAPVSPQNSQSEGFTAGAFGQGIMGTISGIPVVMSSGLTSTEAVLFSTAGIEVFEQRVGALQVTEPSVLGVQVAYAGYFTPLITEAAAVIPLARS
jgi:HK97 family phage major capsid protein